jgi:cob(I)alamin adenosyltransferase
MPRLTRIYTRTGDEGMTGLGTRQRVPKDHVRVQAYGDVDELNAAIGAAIACGLDEVLAQELASIQNELFHLGADLAFPKDDGTETAVPRIDERHVKSLERLIDGLNEHLGPLENFILPGGSSGAAALHVARTVCRRAERSVVQLNRQSQVGPWSLAYLNRLSDALFVIARFENHQRGIAEPIWNTRV